MGFSHLKLCLHPASNVMMLCFLILVAETPTTVVLCASASVCLQSRLCEPQRWHYSSP